MKRAFSALTALSLRFRAVTIALAVAVSIAGIVAVTQLKQELIPSISFPQTIILAQASGMTGEQVLDVVTRRIETAVDSVPQVVNLESTTTGAFGAIITARNNFGEDQEEVRSAIQAAIDEIWFPLRRIGAPEGEDSAAFAARLLGDMAAEPLIWLHEGDSTFLFQLSPQVWSALSPETTTTLLGYLAQQTEAGDATGSALRSLVENEIVPLLDNIEQVARVQVSGGQVLPGAGGALPVAAESGEGETQSLLLGLTPEVWTIASAKATAVSGQPLDANAVAALAAVPVDIPQSAPALPESWQIDRFKDARDLREMRTLTRSVGAVINTFAESGAIVGAIGQTDDLTPEVIQQMLAIDPALVEYFESDQLAAMSADVFAELPAEYLAGLDGFTRDALAAKAIAEAITGSAAEAAPVDLPQAWRIQPPQLILFSFDDIPLASFSVAGTGLDEAAVVQTSAAEADSAVEAAATETPQAETVAQTGDIPEGPAMPALMGLIGTFIGTELNTADDLLDIQLSGDLAAQLGGGSLRAADLLNFLMLLGDPDALPEGAPSLPIPGGPGTIISAISAEAFAFIAEYDETFAPTLSAQVYDALSDEVLALSAAQPPLDQVWTTLAGQPQFADSSLNSARDLLMLGNGSAAAALNGINAAAPEAFAGYEVRLFNSLTPGALRFFAVNEPAFFEQLSGAVVAKFASAALEEVPASVIDALDADTAASVRAIASGEAPSAAEALAALYQQDVPPGDPNAPALDPQWQFIGDFVGVELDSADDFARFFPSTANFINQFWDSAQGASFGVGLLGSLTPDQLGYMVDKEADLLSNLRIEALQSLSADLVATLPQDVQDRIASGAVPFVPTNTVTRLNGNSSLNITVYKTKEANNVEAFHIVEDVLAEIDAERADVTVGIAFEQASFVEESINGVAREGGLGAIFAIIVILVFLSSGAWSRGPRAIVGVVMVAVFLGLLAVLIFQQSGATGGDLGEAFEQLDTVVRVMLLGGAVTGLIVLLYPGKLPYPSWRSTLVTAISIPLSVLMAMALMRWMPPIVHDALQSTGSTDGLIGFMMRLFPSSITLNIMTLSGLTVAIGRVVDDSIVVLENIFRQVQQGGDKRQAILTGTRDVSVAIFAATVITVVVFLPLGLTGGIIGEFFLPFGLAVTYALGSSFVVALTVVPVAAYLLLDEREIGHESEGVPERVYMPVLRWALDKRVNAFIILVVAFVSLAFSGVLFGSRPLAFLPSFGEPQITVSVSMPVGTKLVETNAAIEAFEGYIRANYNEDEIEAINTIVGGGVGLESLILGSSEVNESQAQVTLGIPSPEALDALTGRIRADAERMFGQGNVTVSGASLSEQGFGGFELVMSGPQEDLEAVNAAVITALNETEGLANATSSLAQAGAAGGDSATYIRIDGQSALSFSAELETQDSIGVTQNAIRAIQALPDLPATVTVEEGFDSRQQTEGFAALFTAMMIAIALVVVILIVTFGSIVHWLDIILSIMVAPVGAAVALALTDRTLGISALIGMLMLIGIVVTNAVVLIDRVLANQRERGMNTHDALYEAGGRRLRPILMTALATIFALIPLAVGLSEGAIIASELGTVVIGGLFSSTLLTLIVVPVAYSLLDPLHKRLTGRRGR
ncbi:MAG: efflux RND transporter permease subunit [Anaerolineae bacterium]|nr:efflux RND transporter permease subunit [Anaerolineae bacterium]NUQ03830.1 efflux RND transporter permease subunit [Anaerolineae bacterium]